MYQLLDSFLKKAKKLNSKRILFPETDDDRTIIALEKILKLQLCHPVLIGEIRDLQKKAKKLKLNIDFTKCSFISLEDKDFQKQFTKQLYNLRKKKGLTVEGAAALVADINYFAVMCLHNNLVDGIVSGATSSTASTLRPAFQIIKTLPSHPLAYGAFLMAFPHRSPLLFADCAVNVDPTAKELADIAISTAETAKKLGLRPKVALLSFSSHGSSNHPQALKVAQATKILRKRAPQLLADGELQADSALVASVAKFKAPKSKIKGNANVLIFPTLSAGNIGYKLVERLAGAIAIGTIVEGLRKPVNDLSRGCQPSDIVYLTAITVLQTQK